VSALDDKTDDLYRLPLADFTPARNALAKSIGGADAARVRALAKPPLVPWAVNQVYWRARSVYDRLMKSGERLRKAQVDTLEGRAADVRAAGDAHRRAIAEAVAEAGRLAAAAGSKPSPDALMRTFEALSVATEGSEPPGRLTQPLQPAGFEALAGVTPKPAVRSVRLQADRDRGVRGQADPDRSVRLQADRDPDVRHQAERDRGTRVQEARERRLQADRDRKREVEIKTAQAALARAEAAEGKARAIWERAHDTLLHARSTLSSLKSTR
jgi:hypothetical protein